MAETCCALPLKDDDYERISAALSRLDQTKARSAVSRALLARRRHTIRCYPEGDRLIVDVEGWEYEYRGQRKGSTYRTYSYDARLFGGRTQKSAVLLILLVDALTDAKPNMKRDLSSIFASHSQTLFYAVADNINDPMLAMDARMRLDKARLPVFR